MTVYRWGVFQPGVASAGQLVGAPNTVAKSLRALQEATGADELMLTTSTHDPSHRTRSPALAVAVWNATSSKLVQAA